MHFLHVLFTTCTQEIAQRRENITKNAALETPSTDDDPPTTPQTVLEADDENESADENNNDDTVDSLKEDDAEKSSKSFNALSSYICSNN